MIDFGQMESVLGLAGTALGVGGKAVSTVEAVKKLLKSDKKPENTEAADLLNTLAAELTAVNMMNVQLSEALKALAHDWKRENEFDAERAKYRIVSTPAGDIVYQLAEEEYDGIIPMHFVCPVCMKRDKLISFITGEGDYKVCQTDERHAFRFSFEQQSSVAEFQRQERERF